MPIRSLCAVALGCFCLVACGGGSSKGGTGGAGLGGEGGGTGGANGSTFRAIAPCNSESDYQMGSNITFPNGDDSYSPKCLKIAMNSSVTFTPMAGANFSTYPLAPSQFRGSTSDNPIQMVENPSTAPRSFDFGVPGFYGFFCITAGGDSDGAGMTGVVWVQ
jgi:plastocyanin